MKKKIKVLLAALGILLIALLITFYLSKDWMVGKAIQKVQAKLKARYGLTLAFGSYTLNGWDKLVMKNISCTTSENDTLAFVENAAVEVNILPVIRGKIQLSKLTADNGLLNLVHARQIKRKSAESTAPKDTTADATGKIKKYLNYFDELTDALPKDIKVSNFKVLYKDSTDDLQGTLNSFSYIDEQAEATLNLNLNGTEQNWKIEGSFNKKSKETHLTFQSPSIVFININRLRTKAKGDIGIRHAVFDLENFDDDDDNEIKLEGKVSAEDVFLYSEPLSNDTLKVKSGAIAFNARISEEKLVLDSSSTVRLNKINGNIGFVYNRGEIKSRSLVLKVPEMPAQDFISSMPEGTFDKIRTMKMEGQFAYNLRVHHEILSEEDSVYFDSDLDGFNLKITDHGEAELNKLNSAFPYKPYNSNRRIIVGPENPGFVPIEEISDTLKECVNISEDGVFYSHKGFNEEAFMKSIVENLKAGRFRRGGSTISMQLVKNVFLSHEKAIDRKMEEAMMVWLIENMRLSSKHRMYEVYLNIIEWGPGIYGIGEASRFYFNKHPSQLNLNESIFLALIVPSPRTFKYKFDDQGKLKEYIGSYYKLIGNKLLRRGKITEERRDAMIANVELKGPARDHLIIKKDDSDTLEKEDQEIEKKWWQKILDKVF